MMNNIILNGVNSNTIQGLIIQELPPISKPAIRTEIEEIDGRDGDVITKLGYAAYDKQLSIGLYGNYDINQVISFFNTSGTVIFSNEPDKYYNYQILNEIDFERLVRFRTAIVTMHVQPFKYSATETPQELSGTVITGEGTNINLVNTTDSGLFTDLQKKGDTFQQTYSGKNKLNYLTSVNGAITVNSTSETLNSDTKAITSAWIPCKPNTSYTISGGNNRQRWQTKDSNSTITYVSDSSATITTNAEAAYLRCYYYYSSSNINPTSITNVQIEEGTTATSYEPYVGGTPSPNPSYPQEIKTVSGNNNVVICGKNLFNKENITSGVALNVNTGGTYNDNNSFLTDYVNIKGIDKICWNGFSHSTNPYTYYAIYDTNKTYISGAILRDSIQTLSIPNTAYYIRFSFINSYLDTLQIEKGSTATEYEAYQSQTYPISLGNIELCMINGAYDYIYKNNGTWYKHSVIGKVVLNGDESWTYQSNYYRFYTSLPNNVLQSARANSLSNYYMYGNTETTNNAFFISTNNSLLIRNENITSATDFKTWLSTHNTSVYYLLATPTDTEITDSTLLSQLNALGNATTYADQTNISTSGEKLSPILYVETVAVDDPTLKITNSGNTTAKPIMTLYGTGTINLSLNGEQIFVIDLSSENYITIDVANMEAYYNGILKNRLVTGNYENFALNQGENEITFTGTLYSLTISNYSRWI